MQRIDARRGFPVRDARGHKRVARLWDKWRAKGEYRAEMMVTMLTPLPISAYGVILLGVLASAGGFWMLGRANPWASYGGLFIAIVGMGVVGGVISVSTNRRLIQQRALKFAAQGECPVCRYDLAGLTPESDGCTICPECGAAWRVESTPSPPESA